MDGLTPADLGAICGSNNNGMFGDGAWWIIVLFLFAFNGWGGFGNNGGGIQTNYTLASDFATLQRQIDSQTGEIMRQTNSIANGLCDGFYTQAQLANGLERSITQAQIAEMQNTNATQAQLANCCCENREAIAQVRYDMATNTRDIIDAQNAGTRAILDALCAQRIEAKDAKIAEMQQQIFGLQLSASQSAQNAYLVNELAPKVPVASYIVPNPFSGTGCCPYNG